jgi:MFS superfamily sulfate permease-like transporter
LPTVHQLDRDPGGRWLASPATGDHAYGSLAAGMIVLTGILFLCSGLLRLGFVTQFLSRPVMEGFVFGLAIFVTVGQLPKLFGLEKGSGDTISQFVHLVTHLGGASWTTFAVVAVALVLLLSLVTVLALTPLFTDPPEAVLAAMIIHAVSHLMKVAEMRRFYQLRPREFWLGMLTLLGVVVLDVLPGLVYANAQPLRDTELARAAGPGVHTVILDLDANDDLDITSSEVLEKLSAALGRTCG